MNTENLGPAERIINTLITYVDHAIHNRPGMVVADTSTPVGLRWYPVTHKVENGEKVVYELRKIGRKTSRIRKGIIQDDGNIVDAGRVVGRYQPSGIFAEVATWMYKQISEVWRLDNEFAAHWASYAFSQEHRDLKVIIAAFMLVQSRKGDPVMENGKLAFHDEDYRDIGEAMVLSTSADGKFMDAKLISRIHDILSVPGIAAINRELGFGKSVRRPFYGRWNKSVEKYLSYREDNQKLFEDQIKKGFRTTLMGLSQTVGYRPNSTRFFDILRWKQKQSEDGRRTLSIGKEVSAAESWTDLTEEQICERIIATRPDFKRIVSLLPNGITRAIMAAAIGAGTLSDKDLIIKAPTLEALGLLDVQEIKERLDHAISTAEDMRASNIALRVKSKELQEKLQEASDNAVKKAVAEVVRGIRIYFMVDISGSMEGAIELAKTYIAKFLQGFPADKVHISVFNTSGREIQLKHASAAGVANAFRGISAGGGTDYGAGVRVLQNYAPATDEDVLFIFVGDEDARVFTQAVRQSGLNPMAFGFVKVVGNYGMLMNNQMQLRAEMCVAVRQTAVELGIPCFLIDKDTFEDPYAIPRTIRNLVASTPVNRTIAKTVSRVSLVDTIAKTPLLKKPVWA